MSDVTGASGRVSPPNSVGVIVMALGIFAAASLPRLPFAAALAEPAAAAVAAVWLATAVALVASLGQGGLTRRTEPLVESFGIGTWVAGTAVLARVLMLALPTDLWPARAAFVASLGLWLWFIPRAVGYLARLVRSQVRPNGIILLSTVATQAVALMALRLFAAVGAVRDTAAVLMAFGAACYAVAAFAVVRAYTCRTWRLAADWANGNCILHGALSITGLAAVVGGWFGAGPMSVYWAAVVVVLVLVEAVEIARLAARVREFGWRTGIAVYDPSQWARNFTFGMFYAFTLAFARQDPAIGPSALNALRNLVLANGAYIVLFFLAVEVALMLLGRRSVDDAAPA